MATEVIEIDDKLLDYIVWPGRDPGIVKKAWTVWFFDGNRSWQYHVTWCEGESEIIDPVRFVLDNLDQAITQKVPHG